MFWTARCSADQRPLAFRTASKRRRRPNQMHQRL